VLQRPASSVGPELDRYLRETELMVVQRRFSDRTRYARNPSFAAGLARVTRSLSSTHQHVDLKQLDVHVSPLDSGSCLVEVSTDLGTVRAGLLGGIVGSTGGLAAGWSTVVWATPIADPLILVGIPALAAAWLGTLVIYRTVSNSAEEKLEPLLDRLEHRELSRLRDAERTHAGRFAGPYVSLPSALRHNTPAPTRLAAAISPNRGSNAFRSSIENSPSGPLRSLPVAASR
jgi:hypothetical protein